MGHSIKNNFARVGSIKKFFFKFMCLWLLWVFTAVLGLSLAAVSGGATLHCGAQPPHCSGSSCCRAWTPGFRAAVVWFKSPRALGSAAVVHRPSYCLSCRILPRPGMEPMFSELAGGFLTTGPPRSPRFVFLKLKNS